MRSERHRSDAFYINMGAMAGKMQSDIGAWFFAVL
jgi:hypothetical protein